MFLKCKDFERQEFLSKEIGKCFDLEGALNLQIEKLEIRLNMIREVRKKHLEELNELELES
jgi:hypothetical protein